MSGIGAQDDEFFASVIAASLLGRLQLRDVPFDVRMLRLTGSARGYWVGQSKAIPLSKQSMTGSILERRKVAAIIVATIESLTAANELAERRFEADLRNALVGALDEAFIDVANAGVSGEMPASVTYGATHIASASDPGADIAGLVEAFTGDLSTATFVTDPLTATQIALARDAAGGFSFPDCGPRGGSLVGIPLLTSRGSPRDSNGGQLVLLDPAGIASHMESIEVAKSTQTTLEMADDPTGATDAPAAMTKTMVNLFQTESVAFKALMHGNWEVQRPAVAVITGADYPVEVLS
jgi:HK97 family phage major capsid protein